MNKEDADIKTQLKHFAAQFGPASILPALVLAVNEDDTIQIKFSDESTIEDCRLKSVVKDGNKVLLIPAVASNVLVGRIDNSDEYIVLSVDEISRLLLLIGDVKFEVDESGFLIKKGDDTLRQILQLQNEAMQQIVVIYGNSPDYSKLSQAAEKINNILL